MNLPCEKFLQYGTIKDATLPVPFMPDRAARQRTDQTERPRPLPSDVKEMHTMEITHRFKIPEENEKAAAFWAEKGRVGSHGCR